MLKETIIEYLQELDLYHRSDDLIIDILIDEMEIYKACMDDIRGDGTEMNIQQDITRNPDKESFNIINRTVAVRQQSVKNIMALTKQLGMSPAERQKLKLMLEEREDEFEEAFGK